MPVYPPAYFQKVEATVASMLARVSNLHFTGSLVTLEPNQPIIGAMRAVMELAATMPCRHPVHS